LNWKNRKKKEKGQARDSKERKPREYSDWTELKTFLLPFFF
jgi:hypothetical protein